MLDATFHRACVLSVEKHLALTGIAARLHRTHPLSNDRAIAYAQAYYPRARENFGTGAWRIEQMESIAGAQVPRPDPLAIRIDAAFTTRVLSSLLLCFLDGLLERTSFEYDNSLLHQTDGGIEGAVFSLRLALPCGAIDCFHSVPRAGHLNS